MFSTNSLRVAIALAAVTCAAPLAGRGVPQAKLAAAKAIRCAFILNATGTWQQDGKPDAGTKPSSLSLRFDSIDTDEGTAKLRTGSMESEIIARSVPGYLHLIQSFRTGPLYTTTVFDKEAGAGKLKAVHSRHEYFTVPVPGAASSPEQYYGECEILN